MLALLAKIKEGKSWTDRYTKLSEISRIPPIAAIRDEVATTVDKYLLSRESGERHSAIAVIEKWGTEANVPSLLKLADSIDASSAADALEALGACSRSPEVAAKIAGCLSEQSLQYKAKAGLKAMGSAAEEATIDVLEKNEDEEVRRAALDVLGDIGTAKSVSVLQKYANSRANSSIRYAAESALRQMESRRKKNN